MAEETWHQGLTEKQRKFCENYAANGGNATEAARQAGYSKPPQQGPRLLGNVGVCEALEKLREETTNAAIADREERQAFWSRVLRGEEFEADGSPPAIKERLRAAELLGKSQADFVERREHTGKDGGPVQHEVSGMASLVAANEEEGGHGDA